MIENIRVLRFSELFNTAGPEALVPGMLYRDSLSRIVGRPGDGKSFLALDLALTIASGRFWMGHKLRREPVVYVMAEGHRVNSDRVKAWVSRHRVDPADLDQTFFSVPDSVLLTETAAAPLVKLVGEVRPGLVVLDTKNAMMVGEENSATDTAAMRRVLDQVRTASGACVLLIDHTGHEGARARGSSAGTAAMDTEVMVSMDRDTSPVRITAEVVRDRAGEAGTSWSWRLVPEHPAAALTPCETSPAVQDVDDWLFSKQNLPADVENYTGSGAKAITELARLMIFYTIPQHDRSQIGMRLTEARRALKDRIGHDPMTVRRAWSALKDMGYLVPTFEEPTETQELIGPHVWAGPVPLDPARATFSTNDSTPALPPRTHVWDDAGLIDLGDLIESEVERMFWKSYTELRPNELYGLVPQHPILRYRLDFAIPDKKVGIEIDGHEYHSDKDTFTYDRQRQRDLELSGWRIIRFSGQEAWAQPTECVFEAARLVAVIQGAP